jgi:2-iminobutanoate/2-iminopropanoate deaminase
MSRHPVSTKRAPDVIGPYSQGMRSGTLVYCSGQLGLDPATGMFVEGGVEEQADRALRNLAAVLEAAGASFADVIKVTVFLVDMGDFAALNAVYSRFVPEPRPARSTVAVAALPKGGLVEIEAIAVRP